MKSILLFVFVSFFTFSQKENISLNLQPLENTSAFDITGEYNKVPLYDFVTRLKKKFPQYQSVKNNILAHAVLKKHPVYLSKIDFSFTDSFVKLYQTIKKEGMTDRSITDFYIEYLPIEKQQFLYNVLKEEGLTDRTFKNFIKEYFRGINLEQILQDYVATVNSGKYKTIKEVNSKFPELKEFDLQVLQDYVATTNSGKYKTVEEVNSKFPEFFGSKVGFSELKKNKTDNLKEYNQLELFQIPKTPLKQRIIDFYWNNEFLFKNIVLFILTVFIAYISFILYKKLKKRGISIIYILLQLTIPFTIGYFSLYYFKQPNAKLLKILLRGDSKWARDDYELYMKKLDGFYSLKHFDLNWLAGITIFILTSIFIWVLWRKRERLLSFFNKIK